MTTAPEPTVPLGLYSAALDEIHALRQAAAYEASVIDAHLGYATFPKSRRKVAEGQIERLRSAARGRVQEVYAGRQQRQALRHSMTEAGAALTMTRYAWEAEQPRRVERRGNR